MERRAPLTGRIDIRRWHGLLAIAAFAAVGTAAWRLANLLDRDRIHPAIASASYLLAALMAISLATMTLSRRFAHSTGRGVQRTVPARKAKPERRPYSRLSNYYDSFLSALRACWRTNESECSSSFWIVCLEPVDFSFPRTDSSATRSSASPIAHRKLAGGGSAVGSMRRNSRTSGPAASGRAQRLPRVAIRSSFSGMYEILGSQSMRIGTAFLFPTPRFLRSAKVVMVNPVLSSSESRPDASAI